MTLSQKIYFAKKTKGMVQSNTDIKPKSITVYKPKVDQHIREDSKINYFVALSISSTIRLVA